MITLFPSRAVAIDLLGFSIHWYGVMYLCGFLLGYTLVQRLQQYRSLALSKDQWASLLSWVIIGVLVGGRLGYVLLYEPAYFSRHPWEILAVWQGGMSSHGGFIGVVFALFFPIWQRGYPILKIADTVVVPVAIGLAFGRLGNFINQELYGTVTTVPWAMQFDGVEGLRHPTQLYAIGKNLLIALVCFKHLQRDHRFIAGRTCALFLMLYGILRYIVEIFRVQDYGLVELGPWQGSLGQLYTLPLFMVGVGLWVYAGRRKRT